VRQNSQVVFLIFKKIWQGFEQNAGSVKTVSQRLRPFCSIQHYLILHGHGAMAMGIILERSLLSPFLVKLHTILDLVEISPGFLIREMMGQVIEQCVRFHIIDALYGAGEFSAAAKGPA